MIQPKRKQSHWRSIGPRVKKKQAVISDCLPVIYRAFTSQHFIQLKTSGNGESWVEWD
jgi:hypothetical protein